MRLDRSSTIAGYPVKKVRTFLRQMGTSEWDEEAIAEHFHVEGSDLEDLINQLLVLDLLQAFFEQTLNDVILRRGCEGARLANANFLTPISRKRAEKVVAELLNRIELVNADDDFLLVVYEARVFGNYLDAARSSWARSTSQSPSPRGRTARRKHLLVNWKSMPT